MMYLIVRGLHNLLRWAVLFSVLTAAGMSFWGLVSKRPWVGVDRGLGIAVVSSVGLQFVVGLWLYGISPLTLTAMRHPEILGQSSDVAFFAIYHLVFMLVAFVLVQAVYAVVKRSKNAERKFLYATIGYTLGSLLIILAIPWWRPFLPH